MRPGAVAGSSGLTGAQTQSLDPMIADRRTPSALASTRRMHTADMASAFPDAITGSHVKIVDTYNISDSSANSHCTVPIDEPIFQPSPSRILFQGFKPLESHSVELCFRNNDSFARRMEVFPPRVPWLKLVPKSKNLVRGKVAPGMELAFEVIFTADADKDYDIDLVVVTEREKFLIPVRALGGRGLLELPDVIDFGAAPVKHPSERRVAVVNSGSARAEFRLAASVPFSVSPEKGSLMPGEFLQLVLNFCPTMSNMNYEGELEVRYETGECVVVQLLGQARDLFVTLSESLLEMDTTFLGLVCKRKVVLRNSSTQKVQYQWKCFASQEEEEHARSRKLMAMEMKQSQEEAEVYGLPNEDRELALIARKYDQLRREIVSDQFPFVDDSFAVEPGCGELHAGASTEFTVTFHPTSAAFFDRTAFCEVTGREIRIPLQLKAEGAAPDVRFAFTSIDVGEVFIHAHHEYEFVLDNRGDIDAPYRFIPSANKDNNYMFRFIPDCGVVAGGDQQVIKLEFCSDRLGPIDEEFEWGIQGRPDSLFLRLKGTIIGPRISVSRKDINFGEVANGFLTTQSLVLSNESDIGIHFRLRIPQDGRMLKREFDVIPASGYIPAGGDQRVQVDFIPLTGRYYDMVLLLDVQDVGEGIVSVPIRANSSVPMVEISDTELAFGQCLIGKPKQQSFVLRNPSDLAVRFEVDLPETEAICYEVSPERSILAPGREGVVMITVTAQDVGMHFFPIFVRILGRDSEPPIQVMTQVQAIGPNVVIHPEELAWGKIPVLQDDIKTVTLVNQSDVEAFFSVCLDRVEDSVFSVEPAEGIIAPTSKVKLTVKAHCDESTRFVDALVVSIRNGAEKLVRLSATGVGSTLRASCDMGRMYLGNHFTEQPFESTFSIENHGRKPRTLVWSRLRNKSDANAKQVFQIFPPKVTIPAKSLCECVVEGLSEGATGLLEEKFQGKVTLGKSSNTEYELVVAADVGIPLLEFSSATVQFQSWYSPGQELVPETKPLTIKNIASLPLSFSLRAPAPFSIDLDHADLDPGKSVVTNITFDPNYRGDRLSHRVKQRILVTYADHPQRDHVSVVAEVNFPNLSLNYQDIDFGCILNESEKQVIVTATNTSKVPCSYTWAVRPHASVGSKEQDAGSHGSSSISSRGSLPALNSVFDILPLHNVLAPGASDAVTFTFQGTDSSRLFVEAVCSVEGGPEYVVNLRGSASEMRYRVDLTDLDFGEVQFDSSHEREFIIENTSPVQFDFSVDLSKVSRPGVVTVLPDSGWVAGNEKKKLIVRFLPLVPDFVEEHFFLQIAHLPPKKIIVRGAGVFPRLALNLPRQMEELETLVQEASERVRLGRSLSKLAPGAEALLLQRPPSQTVSRATSAGGAMTQVFVAKSAEQVEMEAEAERLALAAHMLQEGTVRRMLIASRAGSRPPTAIATGARSDFILSTYVLDFGNIIRGSFKKRVFSVVNTGFGAASLSFDKRGLGSAGFTIEPDRIARIPGHPQNEAFPVEVSLQTKGLEEGQFERVVQMQIRNSPPAQLLLRANVIVPEVTLSSQRLLFNNVVVGQCKKMYVQLCNPKRLPCEWSFKPNRDLSNVDQKFFVAEPSEGVLDPDEKVNLEITFSPNEARDFSAKLYIRCQQSPSVRTLQVRGHGENMKLSFDPPTLEFSPVQPFHKADTFFFLENRSSVDVEVYSVDFDRQHVMERELLAGLELLREGPMVVPPRLPGSAQLQTEILAAMERQQQQLALQQKMEQQRLEDEEKRREESCESEQMSSDGDNKDGGESPCDSSSSPDKVVGFQLEDPVQAVEWSSLEKEEPWMLVLHGAPRSGKTSHALHLASERGIPVISLAELLAQQAPSILAELERQREEEARVAAAGKKGKKAPAAGKAGKAGKNAKTPLDDAEPAPMLLNARQVADLLSQRLEGPDCAGGVIVEDLYSPFVMSFVDCVRGVAAACPLNRSFHVAILLLDEVGIHVRELTQKKGSLLQQLEALDFVEVDEDTWEDMSPDQQQEYTQKMREFRALRKELLPLERELSRLLTAGTEVQGKEEETEEDGVPNVPVADDAGSTSASACQEPEPTLSIGQFLSSLPSVRSMLGDRMLGVVPSLDPQPADDAPSEGEGASAAASSSAPQNETKMENDQGSSVVTVVSATATEAEAYRLICNSIPQLPVHSDELAIPEPQLLSIVRAPKPVQVRAPVQQFFILTPEAGPETIPEKVSTSSDAGGVSSSRPESASESMAGSSSGSPPGSPHADAVQAAPIVSLADPVECPLKAGQFRWVLPANSRIRLCARLASEDPGEYSQPLAFAVTGFDADVFEVMCTGHVDFPRINTDVRNIFYNKIRNRPDNVLVSKKYVAGRQCFEFGPLLSGKAPPPHPEADVAAEAHHQANQERLRITNCGLFPCRVDLLFEEPTQEDGREVFSIHPPVLDLDPEETREVVLRAYPQTVGEIRNSLVCCVHGNPYVLRLPVSCVGTKPALETSTDNVDFGRLLQGFQESKLVTLTSASSIPVRWKLRGVEQLPEVFSVSIREGVLEPKTTQEIDIGFIADEPHPYEFPLEVEVSDLDGLSGAAQLLPLRIAAESYRVDVAINQTEFDFGVVKLSEGKTEEITLVNTGKYDVRFKFAVSRRSPLYRMLRFEPMEGIIPSGTRPPSPSSGGGKKGGKAGPKTSALSSKGAAASGPSLAVSMLFSAQEEYCCRQSRDIRLFLSDAESSASSSDSHVPIAFSVDALFSKYQITPSHGISFGPILFDTNKRKSFEITNTGVFAFPFRLFPFHQGPPAVDDEEGGAGSSSSGAGRSGSAGKQRGAALGGGKSGKAGKAGKKAPAGGKGGAGSAAAGSVLELGSFTVIPADGVVEPESSVTVEVDFEAHGAELFREVLGIHIGDRDLKDHPQGLEFLLEAESCVPGINARDFDIIFEEQQVVQKLDVHGIAGGIFAKDERVFTFGTVMAHSRVTEKFRISNPFKIPCEVALSLKNRNSAAGAEMPFSMDTDLLTIPPHDYRYVQVSFAPTSLHSFAACFEATVRGNPDPKTNHLVFDLRGEGTLPRVSVVTPQDKLPSGERHVSFGRVFLGKSQVRTVSIKNSGVVQATVRCDFSRHPAFSVSHGNKEIVLAPGEVQELEVSFCPTKQEASQTRLTFAVLKNAFEQPAVVLSGQGYEEDVTVEGLTEGADVSLVSFGECAVAARKMTPFGLENHSNKLFRFQWVSPRAEITFSPAMGHLPPHVRKDCVVSLFSPVPISFKDVECICTLTEVEYCGEERGDWDDRKKSVHWEDVADSSDAGSLYDSPGAGKSPQKRRVVEVEPEPAVQPVAEGSVDRKVFVASGNVGYAAFQCDVDPMITFSDTLLFQSRVFKFKVESTGQIGLEYQWAVMESSGEEVEDSSAFAISPVSGIVSPGQVQEFSVRFAPKEVDDHSAILDFRSPSLEPSAQPLRISLRGKTLCPVVHFETTFSSYRHNPDVPGPFGRFGPLEADVKTLEFQSKGIRIRNTKRFYVFNPTNTSWEFFLENEDADSTGASSSSSAPSPVFRTSTPHGIVSSGKKFEIVIEYTPDSLDVKESFWRFRIPSFSVSQQLLLVGRALEPELSLDRTFVNFHHILVGGRGRETVHLINKEIIPYTFSFDSASLQTGDVEPELILKPMSGTIDPQSELPIEIIFAPKHEKSFNFNVACNVKKKPSNVVLNIKGEGFAVHDSLLAERADGQMVEFAARAPNAMDFGEVQINETPERKLVLVNSGRHNFDFLWTLPGHPFLELVPKLGTVGHGESVECKIRFNPKRECDLGRMKAVCKVTNGKTYVVNISGLGVKPLLDFSFFEHNFGPCFLHSKGDDPARVSLCVKNADKQEISFDMLYENNESLEVRASASILQPGEQRDIEVLFTPKSVGPFEAEVPFEINGLYTTTVLIKGEGTVPQVELSNPAIKNIPLGSLRVGDVSRKELNVVNRSRIPVRCVFSEDTLRQLERNFVSTSLCNVQVLRPREQAAITFVYEPLARLHPFNIPLYLLCSGSRQLLCTLSGSSQGVEVKLETSNLAFGAVVQGTSVVRKVALENTGDIGVKFKWSTDVLAPNFSISPVEGYCAAGSDLVFSVDFHPESVNADIVLDRVPLTLDNGSVIHLSLSGMCTSRPADMKQLHFQCRVRDTKTEVIQVQNSTSENWLLRPSFDADMPDLWSGAERLEVPAQRTVPFEITYRPLFMTRESVHHGSLFIPLPDGNALMFGLEGRADPPAPAPLLHEEIPCKTSVTLSIPIRNWLKQPQRFMVERAIQADAAVMLDGLDYIDVPALQQREYRLSFCDYKARSTEGMLRFTNSESEEYVECPLKVTTRDQQPQVVALESPVRQLAVASLPIYNPLEQAITLTVKCAHEDVHVPATVHVDARAEIQVEVRFLPVLVLDREEPLTLECAELGVFRFLLHLSSSPAGLERPYLFRTSLGTVQTQVVRFTNFAHRATDYEVRFSSDCFTSVKPKIPAPLPSNPLEGGEIEFDVSFEPGHIGEEQVEMTLLSNLGGEYVFPLVGHCVPPQPQGPIDIRAGGSAQIPFKNVFNSPLVFNFAIDNAAFTTPKPTENVAAKKPFNIVVSFKPTPDTRSDVAKLLVSVADDPAAQWVFYLRGSR